MKRTLCALLTAASLAATTGCANMTPEQSAALGGALLGGLAVAGAVAASRPTYYVAPAPVYIAPRYTTCNRWGHTVNCTSY